MTAGSEVVVVGGGVIGVSSAWWLARAGYSVTVVERRSEVGTGTTPNALGTLRTQFGSRSLVAMAQESLTFYQQVHDHLGVAPHRIGWSNPGYLYLTDNADHVERLHRSLVDYEALGVTSSTVLTRNDLAARFPFVGDAVAGIFHGDGSFVDPARITGAWAEAATRLGVSFMVDTDVTALGPDAGGRWALTTGRGDVSADAVVLCGGPLTPALLRPLGVEAPITITPRYRVFIPDHDPDHAAAPLVINIANGAYWRPVPGGVWLSTANVDDRSVEPEGRAVPTAGFSAFLEECLEQIAPVSPRLVATARSMPSARFVFAGGFQSYPVDDVPVIGAVPGVDGLYVNHGHWAGIMLAPASGRLLADSVAGRVAPADNPCDITRFDRGPIAEAGTNKFGGWG